MADNLTPEQRKFCMSRVKGKDTGFEKIVRSGLHKRGLRFRKHVKELPGKPDIVFPGVKVAVFIDGDFWHGWRFSLWKHQLSPFWQEKIGKTRERDLKNIAKLRKTGWRVIRVWGHSIKADPESVVDRVYMIVRQAYKDTESGE